jgi:hypothetical protein
MGYRRPGSDTPTTVWVVTPPLDKVRRKGVLLTTHGCCRSPKPSHIGPAPHVADKHAASTMWHMPGVRAEPGLQQMPSRTHPLPAFRPVADNSLHHLLQLCHASCLQFTKWMHSIGGSVEPLPGMQPFSHIAHIEHSQLQSSLGPNPGYCVEAPPGCDVHITGPSSLEDCGCLIYFVSNFEYQRTSKEECDTAGKAHYELYTGEASAGGHARRLDAKQGPCCRVHALIAPSLAPSPLVQLLRCLNDTDWAQHALLHECWLWFPLTHPSIS